MAFDSLKREEELIQGLEETVRDRTHEAEQRAEEARRANDSKTRFLAAASHDLRQPLQAAGMFVEALSARLGNSPHQNIVDKMRQSVDATQALLATLLDVSTLEAGHIEPVPTTFSVAPMLTALVEQLEPEASKRNLVLRLVPTDAEIISDPVLLERMLRNLLYNALRYTKEGKILVGCRHRGNKIAICVVDTGIGIPEDKFTAIFEDFSRLGVKGHGSDRGLGLGLAVVRRMAELLGHGIEVRSQVDKGSSFAVIVPLA
nr:HAMP domain-containing sensor histidine kinase [Magnetospirillum sulfuroxidans]